jgi:hypothetical protein
VTVTFEVDEEKRELRPGSFSFDHVEKVSWQYLALRMRPIIFLEREPINFHVLRKRIGREHPDLGKMLTGAKKQFQAWEKRVYFGLQDMGPASTPLPDGETQLTGVFVGPVGTLPEGTRDEDLVSDAYYADVFFNGQMWHSDAEKIAEYQAASPNMRAHYEKCAEIRTLTAVHLIRNLRQFILDARAGGHDV